MNTTCHSEYLQLVSVFIKPVELAFISNKKLEREWKELNYLSLPDFKNATEEYKNFENKLKSHTINIEYFPANESLSIDSIYCRDASIATDFGMIICNMGKPDRAH
ncbi:MAG: hypothetical protein HKO81_07105, partial [Flavobacteriaceae bacterium]|nr:hypothetical protein [Flavobacteriaceae bacterium]